MNVPQDIFFFSLIIIVIIHTSFIFNQIAINFYNMIDFMNVMSHQVLWGGVERNKNAGKKSIKKNHIKIILLF